MDLTGKRYRVPISRQEYIDTKKMQYYAKKRAAARVRRKINKKAAKQNAAINSLRVSQ